MTIAGQGYEDNDPVKGLAPLIGYTQDAVRTIPHPF
jgi:hypothetical protein